MIILTVIFHYVIPAFAGIQSYNIYIHNQIPDRTRE